MLAVVSARCASREYLRWRRWRSGGDGGVHGRSAAHTMAAVHDGVEEWGSRALCVSGDGPGGGDCDDAAYDAEWVDWDEWWWQGERGGEGKCEGKCEGKEEEEERMAGVERHPMGAYEWADEGVHGGDRLRGQEGVRCRHREHLDDVDIRTKWIGLLMTTPLDITTNESHAPPVNVSPGTHNFFATPSIVPSVLICTSTSTLQPFTAPTSPWNSGSAVKPYPSLGNSTSLGFMPFAHPGVGKNILAESTSTFAPTPVYTISTQAATNATATVTTTRLPVFADEDHDGGLLGGG
jgi:hypothetical protein